MHLSSCSLIIGFPLRDIPVLLGFKRFYNSWLLDHWLMILSLGMFFNFLALHAMTKRYKILSVYACVLGHPLFFNRFRTGL